MLKYQRELLAEDEQENKMQLLAKNTVHQIQNPSLLKYLRYTSPTASSLQHNLTSNQNNQSIQPSRNYETKQKLLTFPALTLKETMPKFLDSIKPFLTPEEFIEHRKEAQVFIHCDAPKLQRFLETESRRSDNWMSDRWLKYAYLLGRDSLLLSSPGMTFPTVKFADDTEFLKHISKVVYGIVMFKNIVDLGKIPIQKMGKFELDNSQFGKVLGTNRIPCATEDKMEYNPRSTHVVVIYKNHFYKLPVYTKNLKPLHPELILQGLTDIYCKEKEDGVPFGILTSDNRNTWARAYKELISIDGNKQAVETIQKGLVTVAIDGEVPLVPDEIKNMEACYAIHGLGSKYYSANRWFDKTIQLNVSRSGISGFTYEHSPAEGQPIAMMLDYVVKNLNNEKLLEEAACSEFDPPCKLELKSNPTLDGYISASKNNFDKLVENLHVDVLHFKDYGKGFLKEQKLSPDSFCQAAIQLAFFKLHKVAAACYESAHLRIYYNGRTETIRSCSTDMVDFMKSMFDPNSDEKRVELLKKAINNHRDYTTMALQGRGVDRHFFGLKCMALERKMAVPSFYNLKGFKASMYWRLATSQVASANDCFMAYAPSVSDGYGVCYNPREEDMIFAISSWKNCRETCSSRFHASLCEALSDMACVLVKAGEKPKNKL